MITLIAFFVVFSLIVFVHEFGHYFAAKKTGMGVSEFSIGFGPKIFSFKFQETEFKLCLLPLGGYANVMGLDDQEQKVPAKLSYQNKPIWAKGLTVLAGPLMNFVYAIFLFAILFSLQGVPQGMGNRVVQVEAGMPAYQAGIQAGDRLVEFNHQKVIQVEDVIQQIRKSKSEKFHTVWERNGKTFEKSIEPAYQDKKNVSLMGIGFESVYKKLSVDQAILKAFQFTWELSVQILSSFYRLFTGQENLNQLLGPIGIAHITGQVAQLGILPLIHFMALISVNLGLFNLLPFPALDGGRLVFIAYEMIMRRPIDPNKEKWVHYVGFAVLLALMLVLSFKDIGQFFFK